MQQMENILSITESEPMLEISIEVEPTFSIGDAFEFQEYPETTLEQECYRVDYHSPSEEAPDWVKEFLKDSTIKKLFYKAGISTFTKEAIATIRYRMFTKLQDILMRTHAVKEFYGGKVIRRTHIESVFAHDDMHYIYEN